MATESEELVLRVSATQELLERQLREMGRNVETFDQAAEQRLAQLEQRFSGLNLRGAIDAVKDADRAFKSSFDRINGYASKVAETMAAGGRFDLTPIIEQSRQRTAMLQAEAEAVRIISAAEEARLGAISVQEQAAIAASRAAAASSRDKAAAAAQETVRLEALQRQLGQTAGAQRQLATTSNAARAGLQQAGFQVQDFFVQIAGGTSAMRAFSMQAPQLIGALQLMGSGAEKSGGRFQSFMNLLSGPWGVALGVAIPIIGILAGKMFDVGEEAEKSKGKVDRLTQAIQTLTAAQGRASMEERGYVNKQIETKQVQLRRLNEQIAMEEKRQGAQSVSGALVRAAGGRLDLTRQQGGYADLGALKAQRDALRSEVFDLRTTLEGVNHQIVARQKLDLAGRGAEEKAGRTGGTSSRVRQTDEQKAQAAAIRDAARAMEELISASDALVSRYDEGRARLAAYNREMETLRRSGAAGLIDENARQSIERQIVLGYQIGGKDDPIDAMAEKMLEARDRLAEFSRDNETATKRLNETWHAAAQGVIGELQRMTGAIEGGGFLDILSAALGLFTQLGSLGAFGSTIRTNIRGARATGGPVTAGMAYLVGEKGPELFVPNSSGQIVANDNLRAPAISRSQTTAIAAQRAAPVHIVVSADEYFDARVQRTATGVAAPIGVRAATAGAGLAQESIVRQRRNRIPGQ